MNRRILFFSPFFYPKIGGLENIALFLAEELQKKGWEVSLVTYTPIGHYSELDINFKIYRNPSLLKLFKLYLACDLFFHHNVSLKGVWPYLIYPKKKWVVLHHLTYFNHHKISFLEQTKRQLSRLAQNISCSNYVNHTLPKPGKVIWNSYDDEIFYDQGLSKRELSVIFVGRLVIDKGVDLLLQALSVLKEKFSLKVSIVGSGPDELLLKELSSAYQLNSFISFKGSLVGLSLANELNLHQLMVIPSRWKEPFGIVALEGIACGCIPIYADEGGLKEACGEIGLSFKRNDLNDLIAKIEIILLDYQSYYIDLKSKQKNHLQQFKKKEVIEAYHDLLTQQIED